MDLLDVLDSKSGGLGGQGPSSIGRYRAVAKGAVRTEAALDSPRAKPGRLEIGQEFDALERVTLARERKWNEVELVRLKFAGPHGDMWTSEKGKSGNVLVEKVGTTTKAPPIRVKREAGKQPAKVGWYSFGVYIGDELVHEVTGTHPELRLAFADVPKLVAPGGFDQWGAPNFPRKGFLSDDSVETAEQLGEDMRVFFATFLEDNENMQGKKIAKVHNALQIDPDTPEKDLPGPVSQRLIDAAAYHHGQRLAARVAKKNEEAAVKIQAAYFLRLASTWSCAIAVPAELTGISDTFSRVLRSTMFKCVTEV